MANKEKEELITIPLEFYIPDDLPTHYSTNMVVQHGQHEFTIYFFEARPPLIIDSAESMKKLESIQAKCVAKIVVSPDRMKEFIDVWNDNFEKYKSKYQKKDNNKKNVNR